MPVDEKVNRLDGLFVQAEPLTNDRGCLRAADRMLSGKGLANIVEEQGQAEGHVVLDLKENPPELGLRIVRVRLDAIKLLEGL